MRFNDIELIGASADAIDKAEDRELFRQAMLKIGLEVPKGVTLKGEVRHKKDEHGEFLYDTRGTPIVDEARTSLRSTRLTPWTTLISSGKNAA